MWAFNVSPASSKGSKGLQIGLKKVLTHIHVNDSTWLHSCRLEAPHFGASPKDASRSCEIYVTAEVYGVRTVLEADAMFHSTVFCSEVTPCEQIIFIQWLLDVYDERHLPSSVSGSCCLCSRECEGLIVVASY